MRSSTPHSAQSPSPPLPQRLVPYLLITSAVAFAFHLAPQLGFIDYDDPSLVSAHPLVQRGLTAEGVAYAFTTPQLNLWLPLTTLSHMLDAELFGSWAGGHHSVNVLLHLGTCLLVYSLFSRHTSSRPASLALTLLFAVHPLRVESVIWVAERKDVLSAFFFVLSLHLYARWVAGPRRVLYLLSLLAAVAAALSKPSVVTLPLAMLCLDAWPLHRLPLPISWASTRLLASRLIEKLPFFTLALLMAVITWQLSGDHFADGSPPLPPLARLLFTISAYGIYLAQSFWPAGLAPFYPHPTTVPWAAIGATLATFALAAALAFRYRRTCPWLGAGLAWFALLLLPTSGLVTVSDAFAPDRYTYLPHVGLSAALVFTGRLLFTRLSAPRWVPALAVTLLTTALAFATIRQSARWQDPPTLWHHALSVTGPTYIAHHQLALWELGQGRLESGISHLEAALEIEPRHPAPRGNLALALARSGRHAEALAAFREAGPALPQRQRFQQELLSIFSAANASPQLLAILGEIAAGSPNDPAAALKLAHAAYAVGDLDLALATYQRALALAPDNPEINGNLGALWLHLGDPAAAIPLLQKSASTSPLHSAHRPLRTLAQAFLVSGNHSEAIASFEQALALAPDTPELRHELALALLDPQAPQRDPARALDLLLPLLPLALDSDPLVLQTIVRAHLALDQSRQAADLASRGLALVDKLRSKDPALRSPQQEQVLDSLASWFASYLPPSP